MKDNNAKRVVIIGIIFILLSVIFTGVNAENTSLSKGFEKGIPWQGFIPLKKTTFVNFDKESMVDDYAYLASIPVSVFSSGKTLYANPLLFFQPDNSYPDELENRFLDDYDGTKYLMDDWMSYCNGQLDKITLINVEENDLESNWKYDEKTSIKGDDPYKIASEIALDEWSYSDNALVAVIDEELEKPKDAETQGVIKGEISGDVGKDTLTVKRPYGSASEFEQFKVESQYKYIRADLYYSAVKITSKLLSKVPGFGKGWITLPSIDADLQLFCQYDGDWMQTAATSEMTITKGPNEICTSYVFGSTDWKIGVTNMPTKASDVEDSYTQKGLIGNILYYGDKTEAIKAAFLGGSVDNFYCQITKYPGVEFDIPEKVPVGCRDATFTLSWDAPGLDLGLTIIGPSGEEIDSKLENDVDAQELKFHMLGECLEDENYKVVVYALDDIDKPVNFEVEYDWKQNFTQPQADKIASASEGAVLGSILNAPLLYVDENKAPQCTIDALLKLGVKDIHIVDLGGNLKKEVKDELSTCGKIKNHYKEYKEIYSDIMEFTGSNDVVFTTIDPWSYWIYDNGIKELKPAGEFEKAFYFGPATYAAAIHGSPILIVDNHPELSGAVTWHSDFWRKNAAGLVHPSIASMYLTGCKVYDFLEEYGFDKEGAESILTVAGQYEIGPSWTRVFAGVANPGCIIGSPVDTTNWISRNVFYPALIFQNPALNGKVELINGSISEREQTPILRFLSRFGSKTLGLSNLKIIRESGPEEYLYPVLHTYGCFGHRFNERGADYWGNYYQTRTGHTPGVDLSVEEIDEGTRLKYEGKAGTYLPDLSESEIAPFYASKAGYSNCFSTNFDITIENLNKGVISWYMVLHGWSGEGGSLSWWEPAALAQNLEGAGIPPKVATAINKLAGTVLGLNPTTDTNPWRGYDILWGSTEEPDTATLNAEVGMVLGWLGIGDREGLLNGGILKLGLDLVPSNINFKIPLLDNRDNYYDGLVGPFGLTALLFKFQGGHTGADVDDKLENLHSMNFHADSCLIACNYLQIAMMRHGSVAQEIDPWSTSYWGGYSFQQIPRDFALGETIGESYAKGRAEIGIKYLFEDDERREWWWDSAENVVLFSDPDLRIYVPSTEYDLEAKNHWEYNDIKPVVADEDISFDGHMPFGVDSHPHEKQQESFLGQYYLLIIAIIAILIVGIYFIAKKSKKKK